nr:MAG TPA: tail assembly chaperone [Caudoviricetes sp.]
MIEIQAEGANGFTRFTVEPINYVDLIRLGSSIVAKDKRDIGKLMQRQRIFRQVTAYNDKGKANFTEVELAALPPSLGKKISRAVDDVLEQENECEIISGQDSDGVSEPILVKLGSPLVMGSDSISELEFHAKTYGDIEAVFAEDHAGEQTILFIENLAKPITSNMKLQALPSWAVEQITPNDGIFISRFVLPRFLE